MDNIEKSRQEKVAVIGAGPCGLAACKTLSEFGLEYDCFEASDRVGGIWNVGENGNAYRSLRTNTSKKAMAYIGFAFSDTSPEHPSANEMVGYFNDYASHHGIFEHIKFSSSVVDISPNTRGGWKIELSNGEVRKYSSVIVATGKYTKASSPQWSADDLFSGEVMHAAQYRDLQEPFDLSQKNVMVVGLGSSAAEIASELATRESTIAGQTKVVLSARSGRWVIPKMIDGRPADSAAPAPSESLPLLLRMLPSSIGTWLIRRFMGRVFRQLFAQIQSQLEVKLPEPSIPPWGDRPTLSADFIPTLQAGRIDLKPGVEAIEKSTVRFSDGSSSDIDTIIYATGYITEIPFISEQVLGASAEDLSLYQRIAHPDHDGLFFIGYCPVMCSMWPLAEQQCRWIAKLLSKQFELPAKQKRKNRAVMLNKSLPIMCAYYVSDLAKEARGLV